MIQRDSGVDAVWNAFARVYVSAFDAIDGSAPGFDELTAETAKKWVDEIVSDRAALEERVAAI